MTQDSSSQERSREGVEPDKIIRHRLCSGSLQYLVKWKGLPDDENTWENEEDLRCPAVIQAYHKTVEEKMHLADVITDSSYPKEVINVCIQNGRILYTVRYDGDRTAKVNSSFIQQYCPLLAIHFYEKNTQTTDR